MAAFRSPSTDDQRVWEEWLASRPAHVRQVAEQFPPWELFLLKSSGHRVVPHSFQENKETKAVTMTLDVLGEFNVLFYERRVFGVKPEDLEPCALPADDEPHGVVLTPDEAVAHINKMRANHNLGPITKDDLGWKDEAPNSR